jgi:hypothetical protein
MTTAKKGPKPTMKNIETPEAPKQSPEAAAMERAQHCNAGIVHLLKKHNCVIVPFFEMEQVGQGPFTKAIIQTNYGIVPNP